MSSSLLHESDLDHHGEDSLSLSRDGRKLCVRHKQMANQNVNAKLQKVSF
jgi:hypothetical protein